MVIDPGAATLSAVGALLTYLAHSYFSRILSDIKSLKDALDHQGKSHAELAGSFKVLHHDMERYASTLRDTTKELHAVWRYIDAPKRSSDQKTINGKGDEGND